MLRIILGIILMVGGGAAFFVQDNPTVVNFKNDTICEPGETLVEALGAYRGGSFQVNGREYIANCVNNDGVERDVTPQSFFLVAGMFAVPFVVGLLMFLWGIFAVAGKNRRVYINTDPFGQPVPTDEFGQPVVQSYTYDSQPGQSSTFVSINGQPVQAGDMSSLPPKVAEVMQKMFGGLDLSMQQMSALSQKTDLKDRLRQLQEALDANLITQEEFDRTRQQILDSLDDR